MPGAAIAVRVQVGFVPSFRTDACTARSTITCEVGDLDRPVGATGIRVLNRGAQISS